MRVGMMARRASRLTDADRETWDGFVRDIAPLRGRSSPPRAQTIGAAKSPASDPETVSASALVPRPAPRRAEGGIRQGSGTTLLSIGGPPAGVDKSTWQRFRTGKLAAVRKLDLHGMTAQRAFHALTGFLRVAHAERVRCVEIVTGRGGPKGSPDGDPGSEATGVIRREFPLWLNRPDIRPLVLGAAHPHAANTGSVRLLLRRIR
jgi:DNA-nicking Smr family endonuclease